MIERRVLIFAIMTSFWATHVALAAKKSNRRKTGRPRVKRENLNQDPEEIVTAIYNRAMKDVDGHVITLSFAKDDRARNFSSTLADALSKADAKLNTNPEEGGPIDFDPVTNSQGLTVKSFTIATENRETDSIIVVATISSDQIRTSSDENVIRYCFVREDGRWKINDIQSNMNGKPWSVMQLLKRRVGS